MNSKGGFEGMYIPVTESGCWLWLGAENGLGYGTLRENNKQIAAHRYSWIKHFGPIPEGMFVCHKCDTPPCVNPYHLWLGAREENMLDMRLKQRQANRKLTKDDVFDIIRSSESLRGLAKRLKVSHAAIAHVRAGRNWSHLTGIVRE